MPLFFSNGQSIFFAHIPKTGGASVEEYLTRRFGPLTIAANLRFKTPMRAEGHWHDTIEPPQHFTKYILQGFLPRDLGHAFAVVRDPLDRLLSEYRFQQGISRLSGLGFSTWLRVMLRAAGTEPRVFHNHIRPQGDLIPDGAQIFRFEDGFDPIIAWLDEVTGTTAPDLDMGHFLKRQKTPIAVRQQDVELVRTFYHQDYTAFGYPMPDPQDYSNDALATGRGLLAASIAPLVRAGQRRVWLR